MSVITQNITWPSWKFGVLKLSMISADPRFQDNDYESDFETLAAFRAIAAQLGGADGRRPR